MDSIVIVDAGGFGREVFGLIQDINARNPTWQVLGFLDDDLDALKGRHNYPPILGRIRDYQAGRFEAGTQFICAETDCEKRKQQVFFLDGAGVRWATLVHPEAQVGLNSTLGEGCIVCRHVTVTSEVRIGRHVQINLAAAVGFDAVVGDYCTLNPHTDVSGEVVIDAGVLLGSHAVLLPRARVGAWAKIGAGAVALRHVKPGEVIMGALGKLIYSPETGTQ